MFGQTKQEDLTWMFLWILRYFLHWIKNKIVSWSPDVNIACLFRLSLIFWPQFQKHFFLKLAHNRILSFHVSADINKLQIEPTKQSQIAVWSWTREEIIILAGGGDSVGARVTGCTVVWSSWFESENNDGFKCAVEHVANFWKQIHFYPVYTFMVNI